MESMSAVFAGAFRSKRLVFKTMEDTDEIKEWMWKNLWSSQVNMGLANPSIFMPASKATFKKDFEVLSTKALLSVMICLPALEKAVSEEETGQPEDDKDKKTEEKKKKEEPEDTIIGMICLSKSGNDAFRRKTGIGIQIADAYQNKGYGREAINWALDWAFTYADMHRVEIGTPTFNDRAAHLYEDVGFRREGVTRESFFVNRQWAGLIEFGMLVHEWEELRGLESSKSQVPLRGK